MAQTRYSANFKLREDLIDSVTPLAQIANDSDRFVGDVRPAAWLPVQFTKSNYQAGEDAFVISAFKPVALDTQGRVVPAGLRTALGGNASAGAFAGVVLTYTASDVAWGVIDLTTGSPVVAATTYTGEALCDALIERGLVRDDDAITAGATVPVAADADVNIVIDLFISHCVGYVLQDVNVWSGLPEEDDQTFTNYSKQHSISVHTRAQFRVPHRVAGEGSDAFDAATLDGGGTTTHVVGAFIDDGEFWEPAELLDLNRYSAMEATAPVIALGLDERIVAKNTDRTPFECDTDGVLVRERTHWSLISKEGDWFLDADVGVLFLHEDTWATQVAAAATLTFTYAFYTDTGTAAEHRYIHFDGPCRPGDFVTYDADSNYTVASAAVIGAAAAVVGRVHKIYAEPRGLLDKVKTAWTLSGVSSAMQMPGSATKGYTDLITLSQEVVADQLVEVKFDVR